MENKIKLYDANDTAHTQSQKRQIAVEAALEIIRAAATAATDKKATIKFNLNELNHYANLIQGALKGEEITKSTPDDTGSVALEPAYE